MNQHKRGDLSSCGTMRFWQYQSYVVKKTGKKGERWIPVDQYDKYRTDAIMRSELSSANADFRKMQNEKK